MRFRRWYWRFVWRLGAACVRQWADALGRSPGVMVFQHASTKSQRRLTIASSETPDCRPRRSPGLPEFRQPLTDRRTRSSAIEISGGTAPEPSVLRLHRGHA